MELPNEVDEVYEIETSNTANWWVTEDEFKRVVEWMKDVQSPWDILEFKNVSDMTVICFAKNLGDLNVSTREKRQHSRDLNKIYSTEKEKKEWER